MSLYFLQTEAHSGTFYFSILNITLTGVDGF
jgi:hypothetical protein